MKLQEIFDDLKNGNIQSSLDNRIDINKIAVEILNKKFLSESEIDTLSLLIQIGNISYDNFPNQILPIDDGVYDLLVVKLQNADYMKFKVGSSPVAVKVPKLNEEIQHSVIPFVIPTQEQNEKLDSLMFDEILNYNKPTTKEDIVFKPFSITQPRNKYIRLRNTSHSYPNLVGTLDKCKFVLDSQAISMGRYESSNVKIFERDFMAPLIQSGIIDYTSTIRMVATLKYDGVSIEADVTDIIVSARTRGDTDLNQATDLTPILGGYIFPRARKLSFDKPIGMKFEAIITRHNLLRLNEVLHTNYINGRTAIIGVLGRSDAYLIRDYITFVPLQVDFGEEKEKLDRVSELRFLNKYYTTTEYIRFTLLEGAFSSLMYQIKRYVEEAEYVRQFMPFMYDGVVFEFYDKNIREKLGRKNYINQYAMAVKFNPLKKQTIFRGYAYTVGKNGLITPMIYYDPIEFFGAIHDHSTGSSYNRFCNLNLHVGDILDVEYTNDVMPYVEKPDNYHNQQNSITTPPEVFPKYCPCCGTKLVFSSSNKSVKCPNIKCREAVKKRLSDMMDILNLVGFSEESIASLSNITSFRELMECTQDDFEVLGPTNKITLYNMIQNIKYTNPLNDYILLGALGFSNIAPRTWKYILKSISLKCIYDLYVSNNKTSLYEALVNIKRVGPITASTIVAEMEIYSDDIKYIIDNNMYKPTRIRASKEIKVRFTGTRDPELEELLQSKGIDADSKAGVTADTTLLIQNENPGMTKVEKAKKYNIPIVSGMEFRSNISKYLSEWESYM